ncbi:histidine kinase [Corallococcus sp. M34]|uniref:sensor histidine kinase n=1 Tax=Citreicoccus inhibens TaxID=2849499 RepID=UPI001C21E69B|nr:histidine kinase [Citreicoccus inhibens]MBU8898402.1 histidine kinase [Citreicoccus inhibens]
MSSSAVAPQRSWRRWAWLVTVWSVPALSSVLETYTFRRGDLSLWRAFVSQAPAWYVWVPATPWLFALARTWGLKRPVRARAVLVQLLALVGISGAFALVYAACMLGFGPVPPGVVPPFPPFFLRSWLGWLPMMAMAQAAVLALAHAQSESQRARAQEQQAARLAAQLSESRLQALQAQLHPHFLFNTLNAIVVLVRERETDTAARMLVQLSELLRQFLRQGVAQEVTLREEVAVLERYLELQGLRFSDRLRVQWDVAPELLTARVPYLVLQPLVENALRHGISARTAAGALAIQARRDGGRLELVVRDDGPGLPQDFDVARSPGIGLANTRARLSQLYGEAGVLRVGDAPGIGTEARVLLPLVWEPESSEAIHA